MHIDKQVAPPVGLTGATCGSSVAGDAALCAGLGRAAPALARLLPPPGAHAP